MWKCLLTICLSAALLGCEPETSLSSVDDSRGEPLVDILEKPWRFGDYKGRWIVVNYWASWCKPCITEVPELEAFYKAHLGKDAIVVGVNYDFFTREDTLALAEHYGMSYPVLTSDNDPRLQLGVEPIMVLPTTFIIDPKGNVVHKQVGEQTQASLEELIKID